MKDIRSLARNDRGAVTVFLIIIFIALLMLAGLIIEVARIMVAERRVEEALQSAARSVLAGYDRDLVGEFGLYALHNPCKEQELRKYLQVNLQERHKNLILIKYKLDSTGVKVRDMGSLLNNDFFEKQLVEYMKYRAPVRITGALVDKFKDIIGGKKDLAQKGNILVTKHQDVLDKAKTINQKINTAARSIGIKLVEVPPKEARNKVKEAIISLRELEDSRRELFDTADSVLNEYEEAYREVKESIQEYQVLTGENPMVLTEGREKEALSIASNKLKEDIRYNLVILQEIKELQDRLVLERASSGGKDDDKEIADKKNLQELISQKASQLRDLQEVGIPETDLSALRQGEDTFHGELRKLTEVIKKYNPTMSQKARVKAQDIIAAQLEPSLDQSRECLRRMQEEEVQELGQSILTYIGNIVDIIINAAVEKTYVVEYIMDKYTFVTSSTPRDHFFPVSEVEYILCGEDSQLANAAGGFQKIFLLRFGLNTIHGFITSGLPFPLARLAEALVKGFVSALLDISQLYGGNTIDLYPGVSLAVGYADHLRLLLLCQDRDTQLTRMRDLIQADLQKNKNDPDFRLRECTAVIEAEATVKINLWFAPLLQLDKLGLANIVGNEYIIHRLITVGY